ncbi:hypothetical protein K435DRAFT_857097 [Dendrothele bispora CBS 962.96]|uniref:Uncharacterized protein n=1 Tax=Dendrothele bispora (strain CBS 962.96) TaxID=1314807 RepID=A0A4S8M7Z0_DENBC|nr:hypothetical protein K435DRAFT_857097 [Dendrothele bispora CBS 962.96]
MALYRPDFFSALWLFSDDSHSPPLTRPYLFQTTFWYAQALSSALYTLGNTDALSAQLFLVAERHFSTPFTTILQVISLCSLISTLPTHVVHHLYNFDPLINFLTRPLILTLPAIIVAHLQLVLQANLSSFLPFTPRCGCYSCREQGQKTCPVSVYSPSLTSHSPVSAYLRWLSLPVFLGTTGSGNDVYVFVMEGCISVGVPKMDIKEGEQGLDMIELWREPEENSKPSPMALKLRATLNSVHARKAAAQSSALSTTTCTTRACPSSPNSTVESPFSSTSSDMDYDSDNEPTTSSSYSAISKFSSRSSASMTSVSTICSDVANHEDEDDKNKNKNNDRVFYRRSGATAPTTKPPVVIAPVVSRQHAPRPTTSKTTFAPRYHLYHQDSRSEIEVHVQGGETGVVTGGVMLGSPATTITTTTLRSSGSKGAKEDSWRASSFGSSKGTKKNASATVSENWRRD